jgi:hypothetical protein
MKRQLKRFVFSALAVPVLAWSAVPALAQATLPEGASLANDVTALRTYAPTSNPGATDFDVTDGRRSPT